MVLDSSSPTGPATRADRPRLTLLCAHGEGLSRPELEQLPRLLEPLGIQSIRSDSGEAAAEAIKVHPIHVAVVDWTVPLRAGEPTGAAAGARVLQLLRRMDRPPPTVVVRPPQGARRDWVRGLNEALREGAFAVLDRPLHLSVLLEVLRRVLMRHYEDAWPT